MCQKDDLISRQAAIKRATKDHDFYKGATIPTDKARRDELLNVMCWLGELPSAQPERKRGRWNITDAYPHNVYCSECYTRFAQTHWAVWEDGSLPRNFCPNCGADMREVDE